MTKTQICGTIAVMTVLPCETIHDASHIRQNLLSLVLSYEKLAVGFVSHILHNDTSLFLVQADDGTPRDAFSFSQGGQIFHCLPDAYGERRTELVYALTVFFRTQRDHAFFNIIGEEKGTELIRTAIQQALGRMTRHNQHYLLLEEKRATQQTTSELVNGDQNHSPDISEPLTIVHCTPQLCDALLPLQLAYEKEEVIWEGEHGDEHVTRLTFLHALRVQQIFAVAKNGVYIAKGGTNAVGKKYAQLGGIYTVPSERGKGYATALVHHITDELHKQDKKVVLFAKQKNTPALRLYKKCGFTQIGRFEIAYY